MRHLVLAVLSLTLAGAADWFSSGADAQRSGWQKQEKELTPANVNGLVLRWRRKLDQNSLTTPLFLGPIITHRGIKELVIVGGSSDNLYAVDSDLGTVFWKRHIEAENGSCPEGLTASPVIGPLPPGVVVKPGAEWTPPVRPIYVVASDGTVHGIRPSTGLDGQPALKFLPAGAKASDLTLAGNTLYTTTSSGCGTAPSGIWSIDIRNPEAKPKFTAQDAPKVAIGLTGTTYSGAAPIVFQWKNQELSGDSFNTEPAIGKSLGMATWEDRSNSRWIYSATNRITGFQVTGPAAVHEAWKSPEFPGLSAPVVANGIVFAVAGEGKATLHALDALSGKELFTSGDAINGTTRSGGLAVANGHVCFSTKDNSVQCFGLPLEIF